MHFCSDKIRTVSLCQLDIDTFLTNCKQVQDELRLDIQGLTNDSCNYCIIKRDSTTTVNVTKYGGCDLSSENPVVPRK